MRDVYAGTLSCLAPYKPAEATQRLRRMLTNVQLCVTRTFGAFEHYDLVFSPGANTSSDVYAQFEQAKEKTKDEI